MIAARSSFWILILLVFSCTQSVLAIEFTFESSSFSKSYIKAIEDKAESENKKMFLLWDLKSTAESFSSEIDNAFFFQFQSSGKLKYQILDRLELDLKANVIFQGGQAQSRFGDLLPQGPAYLSYGQLNFDVLGNNTLELQAGALSQFEVFGNNLFISKRAFPGVGESLKFEIEDLKIKLSAQQVIPTTFTLSTALVEREKTPTLNSLNANFNYDLKPFVFNLNAAYFDYNDLPALVRDTSRLFGNTVNGTGFNSVFAFDYRGWISNFDTSYNPTKDTAFRFVLSMLENTAAPKTYNQSQFIQLSAHHRINRELGLDLIISDFFVESDAVPAFFTSRTFQTNHKGNMIEVGMQWLEKKVRVSAGYTVSNLINPDSSGRQLDNDIISFNLETAYDLFN